MRENTGDIAALQAGLKMRKPSKHGLRLYTAPPEFDSVSLADFYKGRSAFLVLSGPSLAQMDLSSLSRRGVVSMGVNNSWSVHRPTLWTCVDDPGRFIDTGWKDPGILKFVPVCHWNRQLRVQAPSGEMKPSAFRVKQMPSVFFYRRNDHFDPARFLKSDTVNWGQSGDSPDALGIKGKRSVMLAALRLLHYLGFSTVYLVGADFRMSPEHRYAFDEDRTAQAINHNNQLYRALDQRFRALRPYFEAARFRVVNCTLPHPDSGLTAFEWMKFEDAVEATSAECAKPVTTRGWYEKETTR